MAIWSSLFLCVIGTQSDFIARRVSSSWNLFVCLKQIIYFFPALGSKRIEAKEYSITSRLNR